MLLLKKEVQVHPFKRKDNDLEKINKIGARSPNLSKNIGCLITSVSNMRNRPIDVPTKAINYLSDGILEPPQGASRRHKPRNNIARVRFDRKGLNSPILKLLR